MEIAGKGKGKLIERLKRFEGELRCVYEAGPCGYGLARELRAAGIAARAELGRRKLGKQLEAAVRDGAHVAVILGDELAEGNVTLRDLRAASQKLVATADLAETILRAEANHRHG